MKKEKTIILIILVSFLFFFSLPSLASAQRDLELEYPEIGGQTITTETSIPEFVRYIFNFSIIIAVIIVIGVLIYGGFLYLTSTGKAEQLRDAKNWIVSALLGLIILLGSYLILATVNPQLTVIKLEQLPLTWGVVLLNQKATDKVGGIDNAPDLEEMANQIRLGNVTQVTTIDDFEKKFGRYNTSTTEFEKFNPVSFFILPDPGNIPNDHTKVIVFSEKRFRGDLKEYSEEKGRCASQLCPLEDFAPVSPPMSLLTKETGPGIYLYGDEEYEEFFTRHSIPDFRRHKFNDKRLNDNTKSIAIKNKLGPGAIKITDYLAILHEKVNYGGQCRIFYVGGNVSTSTAATIATTTVQDKDKWGEIGNDLPSSAHVFQLADHWSGTVTVCPATNYEPLRKADGSIEVDCQTYNQPIFIPKSIKIKADGSPGDSKLNDQVRSISIDGNFAVVLFENEPKSDGTWVGDPGKAQVFTQSKPDLTAEPIGSCNAHTWVAFWAWDPCTSGIAIYPIK